MPLGVMYPRTSRCYVQSSSCASRSGDHTLWSLGWQDISVATLHDNVELPRAVARNSSGIFLHTQHVYALNQHLWADSLCSFGSWQFCTLIRLEKRVPQPPTTSWSPTKDQVWIMHQPVQRKIFQNKNHQCQKFFFQWFCPLHIFVIKKKTWKTFNITQHQCSACKLNRLPSCTIKPLQMIQNLLRTQKSPCHTSLYLPKLAPGCSSHQVQDTDACI